MTIAIVREPSRAIVRCELTHRQREPIDVDRARRQHRAYEEVLSAAGFAVVRLPEEPDLPDSVFVEDTAVALDEISILTRPGALSRRPEISSIARWLVRFHPTVPIEEPGILDGGDVLRLGRTIWVGLSTRTNEEAVGQLRRYVEPFGYRVIGVPIERALHLKSAISRAGDDTLVVSPAWIDPAPFASARLVEVDPGEPEAANVLPVGGKLLVAEAFPRTRERLARAGFDVLSLDVSELAKAEAGLTCCSLIFEE
jgi:dimethylargininase